eukprot:TRINITY_DN7971_c0_g1_i1.p2 TRINITY_DN7971_c0_g1~~TRINITY_DN7971_c0_g1_i1.p2  ORF type:complete len:148 (-),score=36.97 TRINITY_DN7971_c0_g1_i1:316-759(-)
MIVDAPPPSLPVTGSHPFPGDLPVSAAAPAVPHAAAPAVIHAAAPAVPRAAVVVDAPPPPAVVDAPQNPALPPHWTDHQILLQRLSEIQAFRSLQGEISAPQLESLLKKFITIQKRQLQKREKLVQITAKSLGAGLVRFLHSPNALS